jgi:hypothetical protein
VGWERGGVAEGETVAIVAIVAATSSATRVCKLSSSGKAVNDTPALLHAIKDAVKRINRNAILRLDIIAPRRRAGLSLQQVM